MKARRKPSGARASVVKKTAAAPRARTKVATPAVAKRRPASAAGKTAVKAPGKTSGKSAVESLGTDCTIEHATALHKQLAKVVGNRACVTLDLAAVKRCDTVGLQILVAFVRERRDAGRDVELQAAPDTILTAAKLLGLTTMLGLQSAEVQVGHA